LDKEYLSQIIFATQIPQIDTAYHSAVLFLCSKSTDNPIR